MWPFDKTRKGPPALTSLEHQATAMKLAELETRIFGLEEAIVQLCHHLKNHLDRIDENTVRLDNKIYEIASFTIKSSKNLLDGAGQDPN